MLEIIIKGYEREIERQNQNLNREPQQDDKQKYINIDHRNIKIIKGNSPQISDSLNNSIENVNVFKKRKSYL